MSSTFEKYKENRLAKLRLGQAAGEIFTLTGAGDEDETRFVLVPLTDGEYLKALSLADMLDIGESYAGVAGRDEVLKKGILFYAARELRDWTQHFFSEPNDVDEMYDHDVNAAYDMYLEMVAQVSPVFAMLTDDDLDNLKKVWSLIDLRELTGPQQYAAKRFLDSIQTNLHQARFSGLHSIRKSTETNETETLVENVEDDTKIQQPPSA